jgi:hypothetical protein
MKKLFIKPARLLIISLSILFGTSSTMAGVAGYDQCSAGVKSGTCSHQTGKNKSGCEGIWEKSYQFKNYNPPGVYVNSTYVYTHCTWDPVFKTCNRNGHECATHTPVN